MMFGKSPRFQSLKEAADKGEPRGRRHRSAQRRRYQPAESPALPAVTAAHVSTPTGRRTATPTSSRGHDLATVLRHLVMLEHRRVELSRLSDAHQTRIAELEVQRTRLMAEIEAARADIEAKRALLQEHDRSLGPELARIEALQAECAQCETEISNCQRQLETIGAVVKDLTNQVDSRKQDLAAKHRTIQDLKAKERLVHGERAAARQAASDAVKDAQAAEQDVDDLLEEVTALEADVDRLEKQNAFLRATRDRLLRAPPRVKPPPVPPLSPPGGEAKDGEDVPPATQRSTQSYLRDTSLEWQQGELLGEGAFARVYLGMNQATGELMAVKELKGTAFETHEGSSSNRDRVEALEDEIRVMHRLAHDNIVRYLGTSRRDGKFYILLEYVPGGSIAGMMKRFGSCLPEEVIRRFTRQILQGLVYLHSEGVVHRDIKGANLLVTSDAQVRISDFGCSTLFKGDQSVRVSNTEDTGGAEQLLGSVPWMAPEVMRQEKSGRKSDVWSLGCTIVEMATGKRPHPHIDHVLTLLFHVATTGSHPVIPDHLSAVARDFLGHTFEPDAGKRWSAEMLLGHDFCLV